MKIRWDGEAFYYIRKFACNKATGKSKDLATHLSLAGGNGGAYDLYGDRNDPNESYEANQDLLWRKLAEDREQPTAPPSYLVERRESIFPMLFDFDIFGPADTSFDTFLPLLHTTQRIMEGVYGHMSAFERRAIVCTAAATPKDREVNKLNDKYTMTLIKRGYHVIYPEVIVNREDALFLRCAIVNALEKEFGHEFISFVDPADGERVEYDTFDKLVDPVVYESNGLRMLGAHKVKKCPAGCKLRNRTAATVEEREKACKLCDNYGRVDEGRPYEVLAVVDGDGSVFHRDELDGLEEQSLLDLPLAREFKAITSDFYTALKVLTIRRDPDKDKKSEPNWAASGCDFNDAVRKRVATQEGKPRNQKDIAQLYVDKPGTYTVDRGKWTTIFPSAPGFKDVVEAIERTYCTSPWQLERFGRNSGPSLWKEIGEGIHTMGVDVSRGKPRVRAYPLINFCPNVARAHNSNRTYFDIFFEGATYYIQPGCYSTKGIDKSTPKADARDPCHRAIKFFRKYKVPLTMRIEYHILRMLGKEETLPQYKSTDLVEQLPQNMPDPDLVYAKPISHPFCYKCRKYTNPKDPYLAACKCEEPDFAPPSFKCEACQRTFHRQKKKRRLQFVRTSSSAQLPEECCCEKPTAPDRLRDTMSHEIISNSTMETM